MMSIMIIIVIDAFIGLNFFVNQSEYIRSPLALSVAFRDLSILPLAIISLIFYVRIRLSMNLETDTPPITCHQAFYDDCNQGNWVFRSAITLIILPVIVCFSHGSVEAVSGYFGIIENESGVVLATSLIALAVSSAPMFFVMHAVTIEKAYKYFDDFKLHLAEMARERDSKTDKYIKAKNKNRGDKK